MSYDFLIFTECHWFSGFARAAGTYRMATELRKNGFSVIVIDFFGLMSQDDIQRIADKYVSEQTLGICFSSTFFAASNSNNYYANNLKTQDQIHNAIKERNSIINGSEEHTDQAVIANFPFNEGIVLDIINRCKKHPKTKVVYGGVKSKHYRSDIIDAYFVDFGEERFIEYANQLRLDRMFNTDIASNEKFYKYSKDNDNFDFAHSEIVWDPMDFVFHDEVLPIEISRGCIFRCKFCNFILTGRANLDHVKTPETIRNEFIRNYEEHGVTRYLFCDDTFNDSTEKLEQLANVSQSLPFELSVAAYIRPELVGRFPQQIQLLRDIGLRFAKMGIESINPNARRFIGKGVNFEKIVDHLALLRSSWGDEIITSGSFIFGLPTETMDTLNAQYEWIKNDALNVLHSTSQFPLFINFDADLSIKQSDIDKNYKEYGYEKADQFNWVNNTIGTSFAEMRVMTAKLDKVTYADPRCRHGGFSGIMLGNGNISFETLRDHPFTSVPYDSAEREYARKVVEYKSKLLK